MKIIIVTLTLIVDNQQCTMMYICIINDVRKHDSRLIYTTGDFKCQNKSLHNTARAYLMTLQSLIDRLIQASVLY